MDIKTHLAQQRLHINKRLENEVVSSFCYTESTGAKTRLLRTWFEGYLYSVTLGILKNRRSQFGPGEKKDKAQWSSGTYIEQYEFIICYLLSREDILIELNLLSSKKALDLSHLDTLLSNSHIHQEIFDEQEFYKSIFGKLKDICDEYMNGGLEYLAELKNEGLNFADELDTLVEILEKK